MRRWWLLGLLIGGCDDGGEGAQPVADAASMDAAIRADGAPGDDATRPGPDGDLSDVAPAADAGGDAAADAGAPPFGDPDCDPLVPEVCAMPWPSNLYLAPDEARDTGYTLTFGATSLPANRTRQHIDPAPYLRADGYSVGTPILAVFANLDAANLPDEAGIADSLAEDAPVVLLEDAGAAGLRRVPYFTELDRRDDTDAKTLYVRPAEILKEGTRYVVGFRGLVDAAGDPIAPSPAFAALRDGLAEGDAQLGPRVAGFETAFADLATAGVDRATLQLAWDFTTQSCDSIHGALLHMRTDAADRVGAEGPELIVDTVERFTPEQHPHIALRIVGRFRVPNYLKEDGTFQDATGYVLNLGEDGLPAADGWREPEFVVRIPHTALDGTPHGLLQYGHGLNGTWNQVEEGHHDRTAAEFGYIYFGASMTGMSSPDVAGIVGILYDISRFPWLGHKLHQGLLESILLPRAMMHRLTALPEVAEAGVVVDADRVFWEGDSQGGIYGASHVALSPEVTRGMLGVPGQNYSTMLQRSVDFDPFFFVIDTSYPDPKDQAVLLALLQTLWDSADPVSYYRHLSADPFPGDAPNAVLLAPAKGDWQVPLLTVETVARTDVGVALMENYDDERAVPLVEPVAYPRQGSAIVNWHYGNPWPPAGNVPPNDAVGDPHGEPRKDGDYRRQMIHFFETGEVIDVCGGGLCPPSE